jgi:hypothetical protein
LKNQQKEYKNSKKKIPINSFDIEDLTWIAANDSIAKAAQYDADMKAIFLNPQKALMNEKDKHYFKTGCKFGTKPLEYKQFHHGIQRTHMKIIDEYNQHSGSSKELFTDFK